MKKNKMFAFVALAAAAAVAVFGGAVVGCASSAASGRPCELRLMSYNIRHCKGMDGKVDVQRVAEAIIREKPDFVGLNEVDCLVERSGNVDEAVELGRLAGFHATFAKAIPLQGGSYGNAVLSREKPLSVVRIPIPDKEPRVLLMCEFRDFWFGTSHFPLKVDNRLNAVETIRGFVAEHAGNKPVFLTGDWNDTPKSRTLAAMKDFMTVLSNERCRTFHGVKSAAPDSFKDGKQDDEYCIDYIAVDSSHAAKAKVVDAHVTPDAVTSDHNPIAVVVELER